MMKKRMFFFLFVSLMLNPFGGNCVEEKDRSATFFLASFLKLPGEDFLKYSYHFRSFDGKWLNEEMMEIDKRVFVFAHKEEDKKFSFPFDIGKEGTTELYFMEESRRHIFIKINEEGYLDQKEVESVARGELHTVSGNIYSLAVNQEGMIDAQGIEEKDGRMILSSEKGAALAPLVEKKEEEDFLEENSEIPITKSDFVDPNENRKDFYLEEENGENLSRSSDISEILLCRAYPIILAKQISR